VSYLTDALVELGHDVTLFASGDSQTKATLDAVWPRALRLDPTVRDALAPHMLLLETVRQRAHEFDVLHFHLDYMPFPLFTQLDTPFVTTLHGRLDLPEHQPVFTAFSSIPVVSISNAQRRPVPQAGWVRTIYHGVPEDLLRPLPVTPSYLAFLGRIAPEKGVDQAIKIAGRAGLPIKIAAKIDKADVEYFETQIRSLFDLPHVEYIGEIADKDKSEFLSGAIGLVMPINWPEPFGLSMIEAMACGTPVVAYNRGSVPEVVEDGLTGFVVEDELSATDAVRRLPQLSRAGVRARFDQRFTARVMAKEYLATYRSLMSGAAARPRLVAMQGGQMEGAAQ
jgi:glycosyltransferase involved in cell wall biosynthesis